MNSVPQSFTVKRQDSPATGSVSLQKGYVCRDLATPSPRMVLWLVGVTYCFVQNPLGSSSISFKLPVLPELPPGLLSCCFYCKRLQHFGAFLQFVEMQAAVGVYIYHSIFIERDSTRTAEVSPANSI